MKNKKYYLAYGSNLNLDQMAARCPHATVEGIATLQDYRLLFKGSGSGAYLTIEPCLGSTVPVGVFAITPADERALDRYEGFPMFYHKEQMMIRIESLAFDRDEEITAMVYVMNDDRRLGIPSDTYLHTCGEGYLDFGFDFEPLEDALSYSKTMCKGVG